MQKWLGLALLLTQLSLCGNPPAYAQVSSGVSRAAVSITSATVGVEVHAGIRIAARVRVDSAAAVPIWLCETDAGTACSAVTSHSGCLQLAASEGWLFVPAVDGWNGKRCGLLDSGVTAVTVHRAAW